MRRVMRLLRSPESHRPLLALIDERNASAALYGPSTRLVMAVPQRPPVFLDGNRVTPGTERCVCSIECETPCWQRLGLTVSACCPGCPPLPDPNADLAAGPGDSPPGPA